jgi:hypothetical protein
MSLILLTLCTILRKSSAFISTFYNKHSFNDALTLWGGRGAQCDGGGGRGEEEAEEEAE